MDRQIAQMREPTFLVLVSLLDGPLDGYAIIQLTAELSEGRVRLATGTLYAALDRLTAEGHVNLVSEEIASGRVRRCYGLTPRGASGRCRGCSLFESLQGCPMRALATRPWRVPFAVPVAGVGAQVVFSLSISAARSRFREPTAPGTWPCPVTASSNGLS
jgi:PadR family transcriptional regulator PadR